MTASGVENCARTDLAAEVLAAAEGDVETELLIEKDLADGLDSEGCEDPEAELGDVAARRFRGEQRSFPLAMPGRLR